MRKRMLTILSFTFLLLLAACGDKQQTPSPQGVIQQQKQGEESSDKADKKQESKEKNKSVSNILIAYFTAPETDGMDTVAGASRVVKEKEVLGNTQYVAKEIQKNLGGDLFEIKTVQKYPGTHDDLLDFAYNEKSKDARPKLDTQIKNLDSYDYIFIGYPNWNADLPMPLYSFFEAYDFAGKTVIPFVTHGGSGFSNTIDTIKELEPKATVVEEGLSVSRDEVADAKEDIKAWTDALIK